MTPSRDPHGIAHHPGAEWLVGYAAGTLGEAEGLLIASHLTLCPACRAASGDAEAIAGSLLGESAADVRPLPLPHALPAPSDPAPGSAAPGRHGAAVPFAFAPGEAPLPAPLRAALGGGLAVARWRRLARGLRRAPVAAAGPARAFLLHMQPGAAIPAHGHGGGELTLVLQGAYADAQGTFAPGDVADHDQADAHRPVAQPGPACICLVVLAAPLRFRAPWLRALRPLLRI